MTVVDPYPRMTLEYAVKALKLRYGSGNVMCKDGQVNVNVQHPDRQDSISVTLTIEQAKILAANPMSLTDLANENYPASWTAVVRPKTAIPRPADRGAVPIQFAPQFAPPKD